MSALNMGFAQLQVVPVMTGFNSEIKKQLGNTFPGLGKQSGADFGKGVASGFAGEKKSIESEVKALEKNLASAQDNLKKAKGASATATDKETDALKKLEIAQLKLNEVRESGKAKASQLATAEENVRQKQNALKKAQEDSHRSAVTLETATEDLATANDKLTKASDKANKELGETDSKARKAGKGIGKMDKDVDKARSGFGKLQGAAKTAFAGIAGSIAAVGIGTFAADLVNAASDLEQATGAVQATFKGSSGQVDKNAKNAALNVGLSEGSYKESAALLGAQGKNIVGVAEDELAGWVDSQITLAADLAAQYGGTVEEAVSALMSFNRGEYEQIERYGVSVNATAINKQLKGQGIKDPTDKQKSSVASDMLQKQTGDAQGSFDREADTYAGQMERMKSQWDNLKTNMGTGLMKALTPVMGWVNNTFLPVVEKVGNGISGIFDVLFKGDFNSKLTEAFGWEEDHPMVDFLFTIREKFQELSTWAEENSAWLKPILFGLAGAVTAVLVIIVGQMAWAAGQMMINAVRMAAAWLVGLGPVGWIILAIGAIVGAFVYLWNTNEDFRQFWIDTWENIKTFFIGIWENGIKPAFDAIANFVTVTLPEAFNWFLNTVVKPVWDAIKLTIAVIVTAIILLWEGMVWVWENVLAKGIQWVWENVLKPVFQAIGDFFKWVWETLLKPVWDTLKKAWKALSDSVAHVWNTYIKPIFDSLGKFMRDTVAPMFQRAVDKIKNVWSSIKGAFKSVWDWVSEKVFNPVKKLITETIPNAFKSGVDKIKGFWDKLANIARKPINFVIETVYGGLRNTFNKVADSLDLPEKWRLPDVKPIKEFATGGYTGPGTKYQEAGTVHAGEYVIRKEATSRLRRTIGMDGLDHLNQYGTFPGFAKGGFVRPVNGGRYTGRFGDNRGAYPHAGLDIAIGENTPVHAPLDGTVRVAGWNAVKGRSGIGVLIDHANGISTYQGHLNKALVKAGDLVKANQQIALSGNTGRSTGPHVHSEVWVNGKPINPFDYINSGIMPTGGSGGGGWNPLQGLFDLKDKFVGQFTEKFGSDNMLSQIASGALGKLVNGPIDWIKEKAAALGDVGQDIWGNTKDFFNGKDSEVQAQVRNVANGYNWGSGRQWDSLSQLISKESSWNPNAQNPSSTAYGLFQFLNSTWAGLGSKTSNPTGQAQAGLKYIQQRYGDPEKALAFHKRNNWYANGGYVGKVYDQGGILPPGQLQMVSNLSRKPEYIMTNEQWKNVEAISRQNAPTGDTYNLSFQKPTTSPDEFIGAINHQVRINRRGGR